MCSKGSKLLIQVHNVSKLPIFLPISDLDMINVVVFVNGQREVTKIRDFAIGRKQGTTGVGSDKSDLSPPNLLLLATLPELFQRTQIEHMQGRHIVFGVGVHIRFGSANGLSKSCSLFYWFYRDIVVSNH